MTALERREAILEVLIERKNEKMINLANEFSVSKRTIEQDILVLSLSYPIYTKAGRYESGVYIDLDFYLHKQYLKSIEQECLEEVLKIVNPEQQKILNTILKKYSRPKLANK